MGLGAGRDWNPKVIILLRLCANNDGIHRLWRGHQVDIAVRLKQPLSSSPDDMILGAKVHCVFTATTGPMNI